jgi:hypothetical protein
MTTADANGGTHRTNTTDWQNWMEGLKAEAIDIACEAAGTALGETREDLEKRIKALELQLAEVRGALDVLRGAGIPGCLRLRGTHDSKTIYNRLDVVAYNGCSWAAKEDNPGELPGKGWQLLSAAGKRGAPGERGPQGPAGPAPTWIGGSFSLRGMTIETSTGSISLFKSIKVDPENFAIKFTASDDSTLTISLLPLFESYHRQTTSR